MTAIGISPAYALGEGAALAGGLTLPVSRQAVLVAFSAIPAASSACVLAVLMGGTAGGLEVAPHC